MGIKPNRLQPKAVIPFKKMVDKQEDAHTIVLICGLYNRNDPDSRSRGDLESVKERAHHTRYHDTRNGKTLAAAPLGEDDGGEPDAVGEGGGVVNGDEPSFAGTARV
jgi:hypothetical protein